MNIHVLNPTIERRKDFNLCHTLIEKKRALKDISFWEDYFPLAGINNKHSGIKIFFGNLEGGRTKYEIIPNPFAYSIKENNRVNFFFFGFAYTTMLDIFKFLNQNIISKNKFSFLVKDNDIYFNVKDSELQEFKEKLNLLINLINRTRTYILSLEEKSKKKGNQFMFNFPVELNNFAEVFLKKSSSLNEISLYTQLNDLKIKNEITLTSLIEVISKYNVSIMHMLKSFESLIELKYPVDTKNTATKGLE